MHRFLLLCCGVVACGLTLTAQESKVHSLHIIPSGEAFGIIINSPAALLADQTFTLPTTGGTLLVSPSAGVSNAWLLGGNDLTATPTLNQIGTTSSQDLQLVAGGASNVRLTLDDATAAVTVNNGGELRLEETGGTNYSAFKAGTQSADITYTLPTTAPTTGQVLQAGATPTNLEWVTPSAPTTNFITKVKLANEVVTNSTVLQDDDDMSGIALDASSTYLVQGMFYATCSNDANNLKLAFTYSGTVTTMQIVTKPLGGTGGLGNITVGSFYSWTANGVTTNIDMDSGRDHLIFFSGVLQTTTAGNLKVEWASEASAAGRTTTMNKGSNILVIKQ